MSVAHRHEALMQTDPGAREEEKRGLFCLAFLGRRALPACLPSKQPEQV